MPRPLPPSVVAALGAQHGVITRPQLLGLGCSNRNLGTLVRHGHLQRLHPGTFVDAALWRGASANVRHCMRLLALQLTAPDAAAFAVTAAVVWGIPVREIGDVPTVARNPGRPVLAHADVRRVQLPPHDVTARGGITTTTEVRTVVDVSAEAALADALITVDAALRRGLALTELVEHLAARRPMRGGSQAALAIEAGDPAAESPIESLSRGRMIERRMPMPLCNVVIRRGSRWARVDDLWVEHGVVGEVDGRQKYEDPDTVTAVLWREKRRHEWLEDLTLEVARWGYPEVADDGRVMASRFERLAARQRRAGFEWPADTTIDVPTLSGAATPPRVLTEVARLATAGYPVTIGGSRAF